MTTASEPQIDPRVLIRSYIEYRYKLMSDSEIQQRLTTNPVNQSLVSDLDAVEKMINQEGPFEDIHDKAYMDSDSETGDEQGSDMFEARTPDPAHESASEYAIDKAREQAAENEPERDSEDTPESPQEVEFRRQEQEEIDRIERDKQEIDALIEQAEAEEDEGASVNSESQPEPDTASSSVAPQTDSDPSEESEEERILKEAAFDMSEQAVNDDDDDDEPDDEFLP